eukprot:gene8060-biopygen18100
MHPRGAAQRGAPPRPPKNAAGEWDPSEWRETHWERKRTRSGRGLGAGVAVSHQGRTHNPSTEGGGSSEWGRRATRLRRLWPVGVRDVVQPLLWKDRTQIFPQRHITPSTINCRKAVPPFLCAQTPRLPGGN